jgi:hypothetical protein
MICNYLSHNSYFDERHQGHLPCTSLFDSLQNSANSIEKSKNLSQIALLSKKLGYSWWTNDEKKDDVSCSQELQK